MRILVTNDDGIYSPGILALARAAQRFGDVRVVAPDVEQSSMGQAITSTRPLSYRATKLDGIEAYRVNGTPADCVALGAHNWEQVDAVLSGINLGPNLGNSIWHSGKLAAAKQAALLGARGIAFSAPAGAEPDFARYLPWLRRVLQTLLHESPPMTLVNVNVPREPRGLLWTRASLQAYDGQIVPAQDPLGRDVYWFTVRPLDAAEEGTDRWAVEQQWISITPLTLNVTDDGLLEGLRASHPLDGPIAARLSPGVSAPHEADAVRADEAPAAVGAAVPASAADHGAAAAPPAPKTRASS
jgi:5'-nucleotidase